MPFGRDSEGAGVTELQHKLDAWIKRANRAASKNDGSGGHHAGTGLIGVIADGQFGQNTEVALAVFQRWHGLSPSGFADADTLDQLELDSTLEASGFIDLASRKHPGGTP